MSRNITENLVNIVSNIGNIVHYKTKLSDKSKTVEALSYSIIKVIQFGGKTYLCVKIINKDCISSQNLYIGEEC